MFKNKKGLTLEEGITFALVVFIILFAVFPFVDNLYAAMMSETDDGSIVNFEKRLAPAVQSLLTNSDKLAYTQINYFLGAGNAVIGYNKIWNSEENLNIIGLKLEKPASCGDKACLCFFKQSKKGAPLSGDPYKPCIKLDKVKYFLKDKDNTVAYETELSVIPGDSFYNSDTFNKEVYKYLLLSGNTFKSQAIYIEKYENSAGEIILYLAPINGATKDRISKRIEYIDSIKNK